MANSTTFSSNVDRWRMGCWIAIGVALIAMTFGLRSLIAHGGVKGGSVAAMYAVVFGFLILIIATIQLFTLRGQGRLYDTITSSGHEVLLRWRCTDAEARKFVATESKRLGISPRANLYFGLVLVAAGLGIAYIQRQNFNWPSFLIGFAIIGGFITFCYITLRAGTAAEVRATKRRATGETMIDAEGLVTGANVYKWRGFNWGLEQSSYETGSPDVLNLVFLAGTLPGSAAVGVLRAAAYAAGAASSPGGQTQSRTTVRIPVTASKADEVRQLVATTISQHLLEP